MKIVIVGASGTIGTHLCKTFEKDHEVIRVSRRQSPVTADISDSTSVEAMFSHIGAFDALICAAGGGHMGPFAQTTEDDFYKGIRSKMMGQINLVLYGQKFINPRGSFTLTTGILSEDPIKNGSNLTTINAAVNGFVLAAAGELIGRSVRINAVSPGLLEDSADELGEYFPGHTPVAADVVMDAYRKSVLGMGTGQIIKVY